MEDTNKATVEMLKHIFSKNDFGKPKVLAIAGSTCSGKTTLANELHEQLTKSALKVHLIKQDEFYKSKEQVKTVINNNNSSIIFYDYDQIQSLDETKMLQEIHQFMSLDIDVLIIEGNMITDLESLFAEVEYTIFLTMAKDLCSARRLSRVYDPPDEEGYFDQVVWPAYEHTFSQAKKLNTLLNRIAFKESTNKGIILDEMIIEFQQLICDKIILTSNIINTEGAINWVSSPACGAISVFIGTTRSTYDNKEVERLEYECYETMAYSELRRLCKQVREQNPTVLRIYIEHRLGIVPIGETSIIIATSSPQRKTAIRATEWLIDQIKRHVQIWKKELYTDGSHSWKENSRE